MPERRETPRLKTVLKMLGRAGDLRGRVMLVKAERDSRLVFGKYDLCSSVQ